MKLYRAVSRGEKVNYNRLKEFKTSKNTLEGKQFFKSRIAVTNFVARSLAQSYYPPYGYLLVIDIDEECLNKCNPVYMNLDGYDAVSIDEDDLLSFNNCVKFVTEEVL